MFDEANASYAAGNVARRGGQGQRWMSRVIKGAIRSQKILSWKFDLLLPRRFRLDGDGDFISDFVPERVARGSTVYDVGGGKQPLFSAEDRARLGLRVIGVDVDERELRRAPPGTYDATECADITEYRGHGDADVVICQALLEHVKDVESALGSIASVLKPGGRALLFVPSRNAVYARLNLLLPEKWKRVLLRFHPRTKEQQGFRAYYDRCTPRDFRQMAGKLGLEVEESRLYYVSGYFNMFAPLYVLWRLWVLLFFALDRENSAETFSMAIRKPLKTVNE